MQDKPDNASSNLVQLYFERREQLTRFFLVRSGSASEAQDLMQELYLKITAAPPTEIINGPAYLYQLGLRLYQDRYRSEKRREKREDNYGRSGADEQVPAAANRPSPEQETEWRLRLEQLLEAVETLPPKCQRVFRLHKIDGLDHQIVARTLGISRSSVEKHMITALQRLTKKLGPL